MNFLKLRRTSCMIQGCCQYGLLSIRIAITAESLGVPVFNHIIVASARSYIDPIRRTWWFFSSSEIWLIQSWSIHINGRPCSMDMFARQSSSSTLIGSLLSSSSPRTMKHPSIDVWPSCWCLPCHMWETVEYLIWDRSSAFWTSKIQRCDAFASCMQSISRICSGAPEWKMSTSEVNLRRCSVPRLKIGVITGKSSMEAESVTIRQMWIFGRACLMQTNLCDVYLIPISEIV